MIVVVMDESPSKRIRCRRSFPLPRAPLQPEYAAPGSPSSQPKKPRSHKVKRVHTTIFKISLTTPDRSEIRDGQDQCRVQNDPDLQRPAREPELSRLHRPGF